MIDTQGRCDESCDRHRNTNPSHDRKRCGAWRDRLAQQLERPGPAQRHFVDGPIDVNRDRAVGERAQPAGALRLLGRQWPVVSAAVMASAKRTCSL